MFRKITRTFPLRKSPPPEVKNNSKRKTELDASMIEAQQIVIEEAAGRRKR